MNAGSPLPQPLAAVLGLGLLFAFSALGEALRAGLGLPLPGSLLGLGLLLLALRAGLPLHWVQGAAQGLLAVLGLLFVPVAVGVVDHLQAGPWALWLLAVLAAVLVGGGAAGVLGQRLLRAGAADPLRAGAADPLRADPSDTREQT